MAYQFPPTANSSAPAPQSFISRINVVQPQQTQQQQQQPTHVAPSSTLHTPKPKQQAQQSQPPPLAVPQQQPSSIGVPQQQPQQGHPPPTVHQPPPIQTQAIPPQVIASPPSKVPYGAGGDEDGYTLVFADITEFQAWREKEEIEQCVDFVKGDVHGSRAVPPRFKEHTKLVCARHVRSGRKTYVKKHPERQRKVPSRKLEGIGCPASISYKTYFDSDQVRASYNNAHSHPIGLENYAFTRRGRKQLASEGGTAVAFAHFAQQAAVASGSGIPPGAPIPMNDLNGTPVSTIPKKRARKSKVKTDTMIPVPLDDDESPDQDADMEPPPHAHVDEEEQQVEHLTAQPTGPQMVPPEYAPGPGPSHSQSHGHYYSQTSQPPTFPHSKPHRQQQQQQQQQQPPPPPQPPQPSEAERRRWERWERLSDMFDSVKNSAQHFDYPPASLAALESTLVRLTLESPLGAGT